MAVHSLQKIQFIPASLDQTWSFFSSSANLPLITPPEMDFRILSKYQGDRIYAGQVIEYKLRPLPGIRVYWMTEIIHVQEGVYFVDEQRYGPYSLWHHQHHFKEKDGGIEMTDIVHYKVPFGPIGDLANILFVQRQLERLFQYRHQQVEEIFGSVPV
jgi:ligand-binding SRPBCC domain-containing protein